MHWYAKNKYFFAYSVATIEINIYICATSFLTTFNLNFIIMKKIFTLAAMFAAVALVSCAEQAQKENAEETPAVEAVAEEAVAEEAVAEEAVAEEAVVEAEAEVVAEEAAPAEVAE